MNKYYQVVATNVDGDKEVLFGSFDKDDCECERDCEYGNWKAEGYKGVKVTWIATEDEPDKGVYGKSFKANKA